MAELDILIEDKRWSLAGLDPMAQRACDAVFAALGLASEFEVSLMGCDDARICELNGSFRDKPTPTNVLSWPSVERAADRDGDAPDAPDLSDPELGDIAIAYDTCAREAQAQGKPFEDHVTHLIAHGVLHLLGYDHERAQDAALMEGLETQILAKLGIPDPY
jgi:probable rRNA maturation factor